MNGYDEEEVTEACLGSSSPVAALFPSAPWLSGGNSLLCDMLLAVTFRLTSGPLEPAECIHVCMFLCAEFSQTVDQLRLSLLETEFCQVFL